MDQVRIQKIGTWVLLAVLAACSSATRTTREGVPLRFDIRAESAEHTSLDADSTGERARRGAARGGVTGTTAGALVGLACGPFAPLCVAVGAGAGLLVGSIGGSFYGLSGIDKDDAQRVNAILRTIDQRHDFPAELAGQLRVVIPQDRQGVLGEDAQMAQVEVLRIELKQHRGDRLSIRMTARIEVGLRKQFDAEATHVSTALPLEEWLVDDGRRFEEELLRGEAEIVDRFEGILLALTTEHL